MPNLRIVFDNAADRSTLTASSTAGSLAAANLLTDKKSAGWRAVGTSATLTLTWASAERVSGVALPFCNLTPAGTIRVRGYASATDSTPTFDTGAVPACPAAAVKLRGQGGLAAGANAYAYGGGAAARAWFAPAVIEKLVIDLADDGNPAGYIEASRLVVGDYWTPTYNAKYGAGVLPQDFSKSFRVDSGDLLTDVGTRSNKLTLGLDLMSPADRAAMMDILRGNGTSVPMYLSLFPESSDFELERDHQVYGKLSAISALTIALFSAYSTSLEIEEI